MVRRKLGDFGIWHGVQCLKFALTRTKLVSLRDGLREFYIKLEQLAGQLRSPGLLQVSNVILPRFGGHPC